MINSVSSAFSSMSMMGSGQMQKPPPPPPDEDVFQVADTDSDGVVSQTELETLLEGINEVTGASTSAENAISTYDADQDGALNGEELLGLMVDSGLPHPGMANGEGEDNMFPPMQFSTEQAAASYAQNSDQDAIAQLLEILRGNDDENTGEYSALDITT